MSDDLPSLIVARLERLASPNAGTMRATIYDALAECGIDVERLVADERLMIHQDALALAAQRQAQRRLLEERVAAGVLQPSRVASAQRQISHLDVQEKAARREASRILRRAEVALAQPMAHAKPTPERMRHWGDEVAVVERERDGSPLSGPRYELRWAVDRMVVALSAEEYAAATRLRETFARRQSVPATVDINGSGGSAPGSRLPVTDRQLAAGREWNAIWHRLPPGIRTIVMNFICEEAPRGRQQPMTAVEFGQLYGSVKGAEAARGVTRGAIKAACETIAGLFREYDTWRATEARKAVQGGGRR